MGRFYTHLEQQGKAEALRQAQIDTRKKYPNPRAWASFVLIGQRL
jgi:CHAT domain-containing protein